MTNLCVFVQFTAKPSGSPISGLMVVDALREAGFAVHAVFHQLGELTAEYEKRGCTIEQLPHAQWLAGGPWHRRLRRLLAELRAARRFVRRFRELRPNLVYVNNLTGLAPVLAARRLRIPCIWHLRELLDDVDGEMHPPWPGGKPLVRRLVRTLPTHVVAISRAVAENILGTTDWPRLTILPNAVSDEFFNCPYTQEEARSLLDLPPDVPIVGVPGTLRPVKGHPFFLHAFAEVVKAVPHCLAAISGDGDARYRTELEELVQSLNLVENVRFLGTVANMPAFYRACDVICIPSRSEPFGRTAVEAMAVGTPVVATRVGGLAETIQDGETGVLVEYGEQDELSETLQKALKNSKVGDRPKDESPGLTQRDFCLRTYKLRVGQLVSTVMEACD